MKQTTHRPVLIVIAGPNGSGKTTITSTTPWLSFDLRSSLLTLGRADASIALLSLNRSLG
jgi:pantothenate kinase-related protein Tda10